MRVLVGVAVVVLLGAWLLALRAHLRRRGRRPAEWDDGGARRRLDLWTSSARCLSCGAGGGVIERHDDELWFVCMRCGHHQARRTRG